MAIHYARLGRNIRALRNKRALTQKQLAELLGCSTEHISHIEKGDHKPQLEFINALCEKLDSSYEELLLGVTDASILSQSPYKNSDEPYTLEFSHILSNCSDEMARWLLDLCWHLTNKPD